MSAGTPEVEQTVPRRLLRLVDAHTGLPGPLLYGNWDESVLTYHFLRRASGGFPPRHLSVTGREMTQAILSGAGFHVGWHANSSGADTAANLVGLKRLFAQLRDAHGMVSRSMAGNRDRVSDRVERDDVSR